MRARVTRATPARRRPDRQRRDAVAAAAGAALRAPRSPPASPLLRQPDHGPSDPDVDLLLGVALVLLVLARQFLAMADNQRLLVALGEARDQLEHQALHDALTGLANRVLFADRLDRALLQPDATSACCSATSTTSSWSTTSSATRPATCCSAASPTGCSTACARPTPWPGSAATSSPILLEEPRRRRTGRRAGGRRDGASRSTCAAQRCVRRSASASRTTAARTRVTSDRRGSPTWRTPDARAHGRPAAAAAAHREATAQLLLRHGRQRDVRREERRQGPGRPRGPRRRRRTTRTARSRRRLTPVDAGDLRNVQNHAGTRRCERGVEARHGDRGGPKRT